MTDQLTFGPEFRDPSLGIDPRTGRLVKRLETFSVCDQIDFAAAAAQPKPPPRWRNFGLVQLPSRAYYEWYAERGVNPYTMRQPIPSWMCERVIERDGNLCGLCGEPVEEPPHFDHIKPVAHGGQNEIKNLQVAHPRCNMRKGARWDA